MKAVFAILALLMYFCNTQHTVPPFIYSELRPSNGSVHPPFQVENTGLAYNDSVIYVLGGNKVDEIDYLSDIWSFDTETLIWHNTGHQLERKGHCVAQNGTTVYIIGGYGNDTFHFRTLNLLTMTFNTSHHQPPDAHPMFPACAIKGDQFVVFGGCDNTDTPICSDKMHIYNTTTDTWTVTDSDQAQAAPTPRGGATMNIVLQSGNYYAIVIGGYPVNGSNVYIYSWNTSQWYSLTVENLPLLAGHTSVTTAQGNVIVFGGEEIVHEELSAGTYLITVNGSHSSVNATLLDLPLSPPKRKGQGATYLDNQMIVFGGNYDSKMEDVGNVWQFIVEAECLIWNTSCGDCLLASCFFCVTGADNATGFCVAGGKKTIHRSIMPNGRMEHSQHHKLSS